MPVLRLKAGTRLNSSCLFSISLPCSCYLCTLVSYLTFSIWDNQRGRNLLVTLLEPPTLSPRQGPGAVEQSPAELSWARLGLGSPAAGCSWIHPAQPSLPSLGHACFHPCPHPTVRKVLTLLLSLSAFDGSFVFCYLQQAPALPETFSPYQLPPPNTFNNSTARDPGKIHNSLSFGHKYSVSNPSLLLTSLHFCVAKQWISTTAPTFAPSLPHLCILSARGALAQVSPSCPQHPFCAPESSGDLQSLSHHPPKANPFCKPWCLTADWRGQARMSQTHAASATSPRTGGFPRWTPVWVLLGSAVICISPRKDIVHSEFIFQPVSSGASLRATWWTKGTFPTFYFTEERAPGNIIF